MEAHVYVAVLMQTDMMNEFTHNKEFKSSLLELLITLTRAHSRTRVSQCLLWHHHIGRYTIWDMAIFIFYQTSRVTVVINTSMSPPADISAEDSILISYWLSVHLYPQKVMFQMPHGNVVLLFVCVRYSKYVSLFCWVVLSVFIIHLCYPTIFHNDKSNSLEYSCVTEN